MLGTTRVSHHHPPPFPLRSQWNSKSPTFIPLGKLNSRYLLPLKWRTQRNPSTASRKLLFLVYAAAEENGNGEEEDEDEKKKNKKGGDGRRPRFNLRWVDLVLDPDPNNVVAVGLTGLLTWASVQVLWQLLLISLAIVVAAIKYSFIAALLIFILITLL
ncbi:hypothetical protein LguiB_035718 [Lonicera macranthoides]